MEGDGFWWDLGQTTVLDTGHVRREIQREVCQNASEIKTCEVKTVEVKTCSSETN